GQAWGPVAPQKWFGTRIPIDSANTFVIAPLQRAASGNADLNSALNTWQQASSDQQAKWTDAYTKALANATVKDNKVVIADGDYGPLPQMMASLLVLGQSGALDG